MNYETLEGLGMPLRDVIATLKVLPQPKLVTFHRPYQGNGRSQRTSIQIPDNVPSGKLFLFA
jgi:hypothetical protein